MNLFIATIQGQQANLGPEESLHCARVLRKKPGDKILLIDGVGGYYEAELEQVTDKLCKARVLSGPKQQTQRPYTLHLAIAPTKQIDRIEWMLEKAVEIGIDEITWLRCKNSERVHVNDDRLRKIVESAVKQSLQARIPKLNSLTDFGKVCETSSANQKLIAYCGEVPKQDIREVKFGQKSSLIMIGPEGDFTSEEDQLALKAGFINISLGENRLRTETAGLFAVQAALLSL